MKKTKLSVSGNFCKSICNTYKGIWRRKCFRSKFLDLTVQKLGSNKLSMKLQKQQWHEKLFWFSALAGIVLPWTGFNTEVLHLGKKKNKLKQHSITKSKCAGKIHLTEIPYRLRLVVMFSFFFNVSDDRIIESLFADLEILILWNPYLLICRSLIFSPDNFRKCQGKKDTVIDHMCIALIHEKLKAWSWKL